MPKSTAKLEKLIAIKLPTSVDEKLENLAKTEGTNKSTIVRKAIEYYVLKGLTYEEFLKASLMNTLTLAEEIHIFQYILFAHLYCLETILSEELVKTDEARKLLKECRENALEFLGRAEKNIDLCEANLEKIERSGLKSLRKLSLEDLLEKLKFARLEVSGELQLKEKGEKE